MDSETLFKSLIFKNLDLEIEKIQQDRFQYLKSSGSFCLFNDTWPAALDPDHCRHSIKVSLKKLYFYKIGSFLQKNSDPKMSRFGISKKNMGNYLFWPPRLTQHFDGQRGENCFNPCFSESGTGEGHSWFKAIEIYLNF